MFGSPKLQGRPARHALRLAPWLLVVLAAACDSGGGSADQPRREPPPPPPPKPATCGSEGRTNDPNNVVGLPATAGAYCLDPTGSDKGYGEGTKNPLDGICDMFDGECEIYKRHSVRRVVEVRYVDGDGSGTTLGVYLSTFESPEHAYAMFTKRVVGDGDPAHPDTPRPVAGAGVAALGVGNAYLWRGSYLAEITYEDDKASAEQIKAKADQVLPPFIKTLASGLKGSTEPPAAVRHLPAEHLVPLGVRYLVDDVLGVQGVGPGAFGYYRDGELRWRVLSLERADAAQAKDVIGALAHLPGAKKVDGVGEGAVRFAHAESQGVAQAAWVVARKGKKVLGVGDESRVLRDGMTAEQHAKLCVTADDKQKKLVAALER